MTTTQSMTDNPHHVMPGMKQWMLICIIEGNYVPPNAIHCDDVIKFLETPK